MTIDSATMQQMVREASFGIGDTIAYYATINHGVCHRRADCPDILVVDPFVVPIFEQTRLIAGELGVPLPEPVLYPTEGIHTLLDAWVWKGINPIPGILEDPMGWLTTVGLDDTRQFLAGIAAGAQKPITMVVAVGGTRESELPYMSDRPTEFNVDGKILQLRETFLAENYWPNEDGPLDVEAFAIAAAADREAILATISRRPY